MASKKHGLGRGLDALLAPVEETAPAQVNEGQREVPLNLIDPNPDQPRKEFDAAKLNELANSIREHGVLQPLLVVPRGERYLLVAGERRWRAARLAGLTQVPVLLRDYSAQQIAEIALVENLQRDDLNALDEAIGIRALLETFHLTQEQVSQRLGMSRPAVTNSLRLLALPAAVQDSLRRGLLSPGHARALAGLADDIPAMVSLALQAEEGKLTVRQLEEQVRKAKQPKPEPGAKAPGQDFGELEENLMQALGTRVHVQGTLRKGKIVVEYFNRDDLERIFELAARLAQENGGKA
ncbi:MAG: ParB/RepB/Spo0J family partition protein [Eubacteriales bacterium]|nr:ParB/RepB/Spo0J family partition protein [Eubacteriales bacterium]